MNSENFIEEGHLERDLEELSKTKTSAQLLLADYRNERWMFKNGLTSEEAFNRYEKIIYERINNLPDEVEELEEAQTIEKASVFLSYNRKDLDTAMRIKKEMEKYRVRVRMDLSDIEAGDDIEKFIINETKVGNAVMMLVSKNSFESGWVSYETAMAMFNQMLNKGKIIPVAIFNEFLDGKFSFEAHTALKQKIDELKVWIKEHEDNGFGDSPLFKRKKLLEDAKNRLGDILDFLGSKAVYNIEGEEFEPNLKKIAMQLIAQKRN